MNADLRHTPDCNMTMADGGGCICGETGVTGRNRKHDSDAPGPRAELRDPAPTIAFMLAGNAYVTFQSRRTGKRFTYRVAINTREIAEGGPSHFVSVLTGPDNYEYLGCIFRRLTYTHGRKSTIGPDAMSNVAFSWVWRTLVKGRMHPELGVWHEGRCGKCGRRLTTPESIALGLGPTCAGKL